MANISCCSQGQDRWSLNGEWLNLYKPAIGWLSIFVKKKLIQNQQCPFMYILSMAIFTLQLKSWVIDGDGMACKIYFLLGSLEKTFADNCCTPFKFNMIMNIVILKLQSCYLFHLVYFLFGGWGRDLIQYSFSTIFHLHYCHISYISLFYSCF